MDTSCNEICYDKRDKTILFGDKRIVDMSKVPENAPGKAYSKVTTDSFGADIRLVIEDSLYPFNIQLASFTPAGFVRAIVENRLEVEGMVSIAEIRGAYDYILRQTDF